MSTVGWLYREGKARLQKAGIDAPDFEMDLLVEAFGKVDRTQRILRPEVEIPPVDAAALEQALRRREDGEPLQYILGWWEFFGRRFRVGPGVLIPRADTEILIERVLALLKPAAQPRIADLCAGSGCIGVTLACERPDAEVWLLELSEEAAAYCEQNIGAHKGRCHLIRADVLDGTFGLSGLDAVVSNPPYIPTGQIPGLMREVQREPVLALDGGEDGLRFYRGIAKTWKQALRPGGLLALETGFDEEDAVRAILREEGFVRLDSVRDYGGNHRVVTAFRPEG